MPLELDSKERKTENTFNFHLIFHYNMLVFFDGKEGSKKFQMNFLSLSKKWSK